MAALTLLASLLATTGTKSAPKASGSPILLIFIAIAAAFYFLIYRPQQRKAKALREQGNAFDVGDEVLTAGGIVGNVIDIDGDRVTLETSVGASFVVLRQYVLRKIEPPIDPDEDEEHDLDHDHEALPAGHQGDDEQGDDKQSDDEDGDAEDDDHSTGDEHDEDHTESAVDGDAASDEGTPPGSTFRSARGRRKAKGPSRGDEGDASDDAGATDGPPSI